MLGTGVEALKIVHIVPGSGDTFYCENCLRDCALVKELRRAGLDVSIVPMYLPLFQDNPDLVSDAPVFFGGINVYLQQKFGLFRRTPRWLDSLLDARWLLRLLAHKAGSTRADALGDMTLSMLSGEQGHQVKEVQRLVQWLRDSEKPDIVHISNALLIGLAEPIKQALNIPVLCTLQDEDVWIDAMGPQHSELCWDAIKTKTAFVDRFIIVSEYYAEVMRQRLAIADDKISVVPLGIDIAGFKRSSLPMDPPVIGYLARMSKPLGLGILAEAFIKLKEIPDLANLQLKISGGYTADDQPFIEEIKSKLATAGVLGDCHFEPEFNRDRRIDFFASVTLLSVPVLAGGAFGSFVTEAMAAGVPVVQPEIGSFPEIIEASGGGVLYKPNTPSRLDETVANLLNDRPRLEALAEAAAASAEELYSIRIMGARLNQIYSACAQTPNGPALVDVI